MVVSEFDWRVELPIIHFRVVCSKGTYIRSLARDIGQQLGVGAHLSSLCRTRIGTFNLEDAKTIEQIATENKDILPQSHEDTENSKA